MESFKKNNFLVIAFSALILLSSSVFAQNSVGEKIFEEYKDVEGFSTVQLTSKMFRMISSVEFDEENKEVEDLIKSIKSLKLLSGGGNLGKGQAFKQFSEITNRLNSGKYEDLVLVQDDQTNIEIKVIEDRKGRVSDLAILAYNGEDEEFIFLNLVGSIDLDHVSKLAESMNFSGLEHLKEIDCQSK